jgi:NACHT domain-containing protein
VETGIWRLYYGAFARGAECRRFRCGFSPGIVLWDSACVSGARQAAGWRRAGRRRVRRVGLVSLAVLLGSFVFAVLLSSRYHLGAAQTVVAALVGGGSLAALYISWETYRDGQVTDDRFTLAEIADQLASAVRVQWETEAEIRRLNDPYPLPVSWAPAPVGVADNWEVLVKLASSGAGWPPPARPAAWADGPDRLCGTGDDLAGVLARVPTGRLIVLGEPGAGKTILVVRLLLDLLARRASGGPVPVLASLASWNPAAEDLHEWLAAQLAVDHPALTAAAPAGAGEGSRTEALLAAGLIVPILDGLDEIPGPVRVRAVTRINDALRPGEPLVVTCRTEPYLAAVRPPDGAEVTLRAAAAIELRPLDAAAVSGYLRHDAGGPAAAARWAPVVAVLGTGAPAGQALATPLMVGLARAIYNPRPGEDLGGVRDPAELCSGAFADRTAVESHLFDAFIPAAYRHVASGRWTAPSVERWLVFLARHLEQTVKSPDLAWWQLPQSLSRAGFALRSALTGALTGGLVFAFIVPLTERLPYDDFDSPSPPLPWLEPGALAGLLFAVLFALLFRRGKVSGPRAGYGSASAGPGSAQCPRSSRRWCSGPSSGR